jgi:hypothetical protein
LPARRVNQNRRTTNRIVGPKPSSTFSHHGAPPSSGRAFTVTLCAWRRFESLVVLANAGISVENSLVAPAPL